MRLVRDIRVEVAGCIVSEGLSAHVLGAVSRKFKRRLPSSVAVRGFFERKSSRVEKMAASRSRGRSEKKSHASKGGEERIQPEGGAKGLAFVLSLRESTKKD